MLAVQAESVTRRTLAPQASPPAGPSLETPFGLSPHGQGPACSWVPFLIRARSVKGPLTPLWEASRIEPR